MLDSSRPLFFHRLVFLITEYTYLAVHVQASHKVELAYNLATAMLDRGDGGGEK